MRKETPNIDGYSPEKRNCTVVALSATTDLPYNECLEIASTAGRKRNKGFRSSDLIDFFNERIAKRFYEICLDSKMNVKTFCKMYPKGRYYVRKRGHAFAIINGTVMDFSSASTPRSFIKNAWRFE
jgi:hypothetical protein